MQSPGLSLGKSLGLRDNHHMPVPENAPTGWDIFKEGGYSWGLNAINEELAKRNYSPVSHRMYTHYRKLHRYGYEQYIPINQLDVRTMEDPVWDRALRGRYPLYQTQEPIRLLLLRDDEPVELIGVADEISDGEVGLTIPGRVALDALKQQSSPWTFELLFTGTGELRLCEIVRVTRDSRRRRVKVRATFVGIEGSDRIVVRDPLSVGMFSVVVGDSALSPLLGRTAQEVYWLFSGMEAVRIASSELLRSFDAGGHYSIPGNRVERMSVESPLDALLAAALPVLVGVSILLTKLMKARREWWEGSKAKYESQAAEEEVLRLRWERSRREVYGAVDLDEVVKEIGAAIRAEIGLPPSQSSVDGDDDATKKTLLTQAVPALAELVEAAGGALLVERQQGANIRVNSGQAKVTTTPLPAAFCNPREDVVTVPPSPATPSPAPWLSLGQGPVTRPAARWSDEVFPTRIGGPWIRTYVRLSKVRKCLSVLVVHPRPRRTNGT